MNSSHNQNSHHGYSSSSHGSHGYQQNSPLNADKMHTPSHDEYIKVNKDPHQHWKETARNNTDSNGSFFKDFMMHWPIQVLERQIQFIASSKVDLVGETSSLITDMDFRWLGIRNLRTIMISSLSLLLGVTSFILISLLTKNILFSYVVLFTILSHSLFAGYITFRMRKFILGNTKSKRFADIVRRSWMTFEIFFASVTVAIYYGSAYVNWVTAKKDLLSFIESKMMLKRFLFNFIQKLPIDKLDFIFGHLLNGLLIVTIFYILMVYFTKHSADKERTKLQRAVDKEHLRPAQIVKKISQEGKD